VDECPCEGAGGQLGKEGGESQQQEVFDIIKKVFSVCSSWKWGRPTLVSGTEMSSLDCILTFMSVYIFLFILPFFI
jgi:hypothetical protein